MSSTFSRNTESLPMGKCTSALPGVKVPDETFDEVSRAARIAGMSVSEWIRTLVMLRVHGLDHVTSIHRQRLEAVRGMDQERIDEHG